MVKTLEGKLVLTVAAAYIISLTATVIDNKQSISNHQIELRALAHLNEEVDTFNKRITAANTNLAILNARLTEMRNQGDRNGLD